MRPASRRCAAALLFAAALAPAFAELPATCEVQASESLPLGDRRAMLSRYEQLPRHCLESMFMRCSAEANEQVLDFGRAAICSFGYEALLKRAFKGDFQALVAWWRTQLGPQDN